ncbi:MAG: permease [Sinimarinibacterium sp.]
MASYLAAHVLLCLLPAFFIAGAMTALIPKAAVTRWLGRSTPAYLSYPAAAAAGSLLAVCSCTIVPLFAGIYRKGAGIGPAITFLFFAPAGNVMALAYTGSILGPEFAAARIVMCLLFGIGIGLLMASLFWRDDLRHDAQTDQLFTERARMTRPALGVLLSLVVLLLAGTLRLWPLTATLAAVELPWRAAAAWQATLFEWLPYDTAKGEEGVSFQGSVLIGFLLTMGALAWTGFENITEGANRWTWIVLGLAAATLMVAALRLAPQADALQVALTGRTVAVGVALAAIGYFARQLPGEDWRAWLWETWRFVKQILVLLLLGVFIVGMVRQVIRPEWIEHVAGSNTVLANAAAVGFGVFMYFPTLVEVPVARMFLDLGMHPGPLLAYLMADPELSLQSMLMVAVVIGRVKTATYVSLVALFSVCAGLLYGAWVDGRSGPALLAVLGVFVVMLASARAWLRVRQRAVMHA